MKSELMDEILLAYATYVREFIIGKDNVVGKNSFYGGKSGCDYVLGGNVVTPNSINEQDFLDVTEIVKRFVIREIGQMRLNPEKLDLLVAEMIHMLRFDNFSIEEHMQFNFESDVRSAPDYYVASTAMKRLWEQGPFDEALKDSYIEGFDYHILKGKHASLMREVHDLEFEYQKDPSRFTYEQKQALKKVKGEVDEVQSQLNQQAPGNF